MLLYTRTAGPRHASIGTALPAGLNPPLGANNQTQKDIIRLLNAEGIAVDYTETVTNLSNLNQYAAIIFFSNSRDALWDHGRAVNPALAVSTTTSAYLDQAKVLLRQYMRAGGGFVAIHNGFGTEYNWPYYEGLLGNANYYDHVGRGERASVSAGAGKAPGNIAELTGLGIGARVRAAELDKRYADSSAVVRDVHRGGGIEWAIPRRIGAGGGDEM